MAIHLIDAFPAFLDFWSAYASRALDEQIEGWQDAMQQAYPELLARQVLCYAEDGQDWRAAAREHVFPHLAARLPDMSLAHRRLPRVLPGVVKQAEAALGFRTPVSFVIYAGIGCGAGWATRYDDRPAVLFGLENIAECGWSAAGVLAGLAAHELGHLWHAERRAAAGLPEDQKGPWWTLYSEGMAMRCEQAILGRESWHMNGGRQKGWLAACQSRRARLAAAFLETVEAGQPANPFFGSWYRVDGLSQTGYYLGREALGDLEDAGQTLDDLARLAEVEPVMRGVIQAMVE